MHQQRQGALRQSRAMCSIRADVVCKAHFEHGWKLFYGREAAHLVVAWQDRATQVRADDDGIVCLQEGGSATIQEFTDHAPLALPSRKLDVAGLGRECWKVCRCLHKQRVHTWTVVSINKEGIV